MIEIPIYSVRYEIHDDREHKPERRVTWFVYSSFDPIEARDVVWADGHCRTVHPASAGPSHVLAVPEGLGELVGPGEVDGSPCMAKRFRRLGDKHLMHPSDLIYWSTIGLNGVRPAGPPAEESRPKPMPKPLLEVEWKPYTGPVVKRTQLAMFAEA